MAYLYDMKLEAHTVGVGITMDHDPFSGGRDPGSTRGLLSKKNGEIEIENENEKIHVL